MRSGVLEDTNNFKRQGLRTSEENSLEEIDDGEGEAWLLKDHSEVVVF